MNLKPSIVTVFFLLSLSSACEAESLCKNTEKVLFNCMVKNSKKLISVCSSLKLTKDVGYLQYRFGTKSKLELVYPPIIKGTQRKFYWSTMHPYQSFLWQLTFENHEYLYTVARYDVSQVLNDIPGGATGGGVDVSNKVGQGSYSIECAKYPEGDFEMLEGIVKNEEELINPK